MSKCAHEQLNGLSFGTINRIKKKFIRSNSFLNIYIFLIIDFYIIAKKTKIKLNGN